MVARHVSVSGGEHVAMDAKNCLGRPDGLEEVELTHDTTAPILAGEGRAATYLRAGRK